MDHGGMGKDGGGEGEKNTVMEGTEHSKMDSGSGGMASGMLMEGGRYSDGRFIDARVPHHRGPWRWRRSRSRTPSTKRRGNFRMT
jgi:hypothetical protein